MKTRKQDIHQFIASLKDAKVTYDPELDKYENISLFPEKVRKAKEHLAKIGMPKEYYEQLKKSKS